jgi:hypothetical protein
MTFWSLSERWWKLDSAIIKKVLFEIEQIDEHISASTPLLNLCKTKEPDYAEICAIAMILHSFYRGVENIMLLIIKNKDSTPPSGMNWHKELLVRAFEKTENRTDIFRKELKIPLNGYLKFRHVVRQAYGFQLKWIEMKDMTFDMNKIWENVKEDINTFIKNNVSL